MRKRFAKDFANDFVQRLESRTLMYAIAEGGAFGVHEWITEQGIDLFNHEFVQSNLASSAFFQRSMVQGAHDEDTDLGLQPDDGLIGRQTPAGHHFWDEGLFGRSIDASFGGLFDAKSAPAAARFIATGGGERLDIFTPYALFDSDADKADAYRGLGHIVHLVQDMSVPAHALNDSHLDRELGGFDVTDFDPFHDYVDGVEFSTDGVPELLRQPAGFNLGAGRRYLDFAITGAARDMAARGLRSAADLDPGFPLGDFVEPDLAPMDALFFETAETADDFGSKAFDGEGDGDLAQRTGPSYNSLTDPGVLRRQAAILVPLAIRSTAEMIRYFYGVVDGEGPKVRPAGITSTDPMAPTPVQGSTLDLTALVTDQDAGDSGVGVHTVKVEYRQVGSDAWTVVGGDGDDANAAVPSSNLGTLGADLGVDFLGKRGAYLPHKITGESDKTYEVRITAEDGAGNVTTSPSYFARLGGMDVDLVLAIDTTGSMADDIDAVKESANSILRELGTDNPGFRVSVVLYKDFGDGYVTQRLLDFTDDVPAAVSAIQSITVGGGGDTPEAVLSGLHEAINSAWRGAHVAKRIVLFGDAPPHDPEPNTGYTSASIAEEAFNVDPADIYPVVVGGSHEAARTFGVIADTTRGKVFTAASAGEVVDALRGAIKAATVEGPASVVIQPPAGPLAEPLRGAAAGTLTLTLVSPSTRPVSVDYALVSGSAVAGADFAAGSGTVTFAPGQTSATIPLAVLGDLEGSEGEERFSVVLSNPVNATIPDADVDFVVANQPLVALVPDRRGRATFPVNGRPATLRITGPGEATLFFAPGSEDVHALRVVGTTDRSAVRIAGGRGEVVLHDVAVTGGLKSFDAPAAALVGPARFGSVAKSLSFGRLGGADLRASGSVGRFSALRVEDSRLFVGVSDVVTALPASNADFANAGATLKSFSIRGRGVSFSRSLIAAPRIGAVALGAIDPSVGGGTFGIAADAISSVTGIAGRRLRLRSLSEPADGVAQRNFTVRIL